jgi:hypothetical protein
VYILPEGMAIMGYELLQLGSGVLSSMCTLVLVTVGHLFVSGHGSWLYKNCHYDCGRKTHGWYDIIYRVDYDYRCPRTYRDA